MLNNQRRSYRQALDTTFSAIGLVGAVVGPVMYARTARRAYDGAIALVGGGDKRSAPYRSTIEKYMGPQRKKRNTDGQLKIVSTPPAEPENLAMVVYEPEDVDMGGDFPESRYRAAPIYNSDIISLHDQKSIMAVPKGYKLAIKEHEETGSACSDRNSVYIGTGPCIEAMFENLFICVCVALFEIAGLDREPDITVTGNWAAQAVFWRDPSGITQGTPQTAVLNAPSAASMGVALYQAVRASKTTDDFSQFMFFNLFYVETGFAPDVFEHRASINPAGFAVSITQMSTLLMQNQTLSQSLDENDTSVSQNPLYVKVYETKGNLFTPKAVARPSTGHIKLGSYLTPYFQNGGERQFQQGDRSIDNKFQSSKVSKGLTVPPGAVSKLRSGFNETHMFNTWASILSSTMTSARPLERYGVGHSKMAVFERTVHSIQSETPIKVSWELDYKQYVSYKYSQPSGYRTSYSENFVDPVEALTGPPALLDKGDFVTEEEKI